MSHLNFLWPFCYQQWIILACAYLAGSVPWGLVLTRWSEKKDLRRLGSGNIGATNVLRTGNKILAFLTFALDTLKGYVMVKIATYWHCEFLAALIVVLGHMFPLWLKFKGGKGVSTYAGALLALCLPLGSQAVVGWLCFALLFGYSSVASLLSCLLVPLSAWIWGYGEPLVIVTSLLSLLVFIRHFGNILRLARGLEDKIGGRPSSSKGA